MSKVIRICFGFALFRSVFGSSHSPQPIKSKTITNCDLLAHKSQALAWSSDWFIALFASAVIGQSNLVRFDFTALQLKTAL